VSTTVVIVDPARPQPDMIARAAKTLRSGRLVAFPTETVYGLGANALDQAAVKRIFTAKGRPSTNPLIVHVSGANEARELAKSWPEMAVRLTERFWPGPLTIVVEKRAHVPDVTTAGGPTVAVRAPAHPVARALIRATGFPLAAPSANTSSRISATSAAHVIKMLDGRIDLILDGGSCPGGLESTVVDLSGERPVLLRPGLISADELTAALGVPIQQTSIQQSSSGNAESVARSPGMMERHYAPSVPLECVEIGARIDNIHMQGSQIGTITFGQPSMYTPPGPTIAMPTEVRSYSARLYHVLHEMEQADVERIVVELPPDEPQWQTVRDRLRRASWQ
jgi:L-threonylcarbamoyladenylate synthase